MEKLCSRCGTKFVGNIDLLSGDFAAMAWTSIRKPLSGSIIRIAFVRNVSGIFGTRSMLSTFLRFTVKIDRVSWNGLKNYCGAKG